MKVLIVIDSFKGSMSSIEAGEAAKKGVLKAHPNATVIVKPLADGGEGTTSALVEGLNSELIEISVKGPLGNEVKATYGIINGDTAVMEMAAASGITLIETDRLNPFKANTFGTGQMIQDALDRGIRKFIIGLGGSATTEGGIGMLSKLGVEFLDKEGKVLEPEFASLAKIKTIKTDKMPKELEQSTFEIACDVTNPLYGEKGAISIFGKQKGVKEEDIIQMDEAMKNYAQITKEILGVDNSQAKGAGAAGGLGFAFLSYFPKATLKPGFQIISKAIELSKEMQGCSVVLTGEGRLDSQTVMGKVPIGVAKLAKENGVKTVIAVAGSISEDASEVNNEGIDAFFAILRDTCTLDEAMNNQNARKNMELTVEQIFRLL